MPKIARSDVVIPNKLDPAARQGLIDALYKVHCEVFDGVTRDSFAERSGRPATRTARGADPYRVPRRHTIRRRRLQELGAKSPNR